MIIELFQVDIMKDGIMQDLIIITGRIIIIGEIILEEIWDTWDTTSIEDISIENNTELK